MSRVFFPLSRLLFLLGLVFVFDPRALGAALTGSAGSGSAIDNRQPTLELNYMICVDGIYADPDGQVPRDGEPIVGEVRLFLGRFTPGSTDGVWMPCDGRPLTISDHELLHHVVGNTYGGDGVTTFALPDLRGRVPVGAGPGLPLGSVVGTASFTLSPAQMPAHTHGVPNGSSQPSGGAAALDNRQPGLALHHLILVSSTYETVGEILLFAGTRPPVRGNARACDGQILPAASYPMLYSRLGITHGGGMSGIGLPDLRGRAVLGATPQNNTSNAGALGGANTRFLHVAHLPPHAHSLPAGGFTGSTGSGAAVDNRQETLALHYIVVVEGNAVSADFVPSDPYLADVRLFAGPSVGSSGIPPWMAPLDGREIAVSENPELHAVIGHTYGGRPGSSFRLPDTRGRLVAGAPQPGAPGAVYGSDHYTLAAAQLPAHAHELPDALERWRLEHFGTMENSGAAADSASPSGDGLPNLLKFATALDPALPAAPPGVLARSGAQLEFTYPRSVAAAAELSFTVEWSDTLAADSWSTHGVSEQVLGEHGGVQSVLATLPPGESGRRFVRLRVTR